MPPKKKIPANGENVEEGGGAFRWTLENERKLLVLIQGRCLTAEDYERLLTVFPGTNLNGVRIKCSRFRVEQRNLYEQLGWDLLAGGAVKNQKETPSKTPTKRVTEDGEEQETPTKKPRTPKVKKGKKVDEVKSDEGKSDEGKSDEGKSDEGEVEAKARIGVKEEVTEERL